MEMTALALREPILLLGCTQLLIELDIVPFTPATCKRGAACGNDTNWWIHKTFNSRRCDHGVHFHAGPGLQLSLHGNPQI